MKIRFQYGRSFRLLLNLVLLAALLSASSGCASFRDWFNDLSGGLLNLSDTQKVDTAIRDRLRAERRVSLIYSDRVGHISGFPVEDESARAFPVPERIKRNAALVVSEILQERFPQLEIEAIDRYIHARHKFLQWTYENTYEFENLDLDRIDTPLIGIVTVYGEYSRRLSDDRGPDYDLALWTYVLFFDRETLRSIGYESSYIARPARDVIGDATRTWSDAAYLSPERAYNNFRPESLESDLLASIRRDFPDYLARIESPPKGNCLTGAFSGYRLQGALNR
jgi:hypothetical protein